jgi:phosphoribosylaminoimidazole-succinocarboxamide synthase
MELIKALLVKVDEVITEMAERAHLRNEDGKIELAFDPERKLTVVDVVGTLDECRFTYGKLHVSKEIARQFYRRTAWYRDVEIAKKRAGTEGIRNWQKLVESSPPRLDPTLKAIISEMYMAAANGLTQSRMFDVPKLEVVIRKYMEYERSHFT